MIRSPEFETDRWTQLTPNQATYFAGQIAAASQAVIGETAQEAQVIPINGNRFTCDMGSGNRVGIRWPDRQTPDTTCVVLDTCTTPTEFTGSFFARVQESEVGIAIEGVGVNLGMKRLGFYGEQRLENPYMEDGENLLLRVVNFFNGAHRQAEQVNFTPPPPLSLAGSMYPKLVGPKSDAVGRLYNSLSSLHANVTIAGSSTETRALAQPQYELASILQKAAIAAAFRSPSEDPTQSRHGRVLFDDNRPVGAIFETDEQGLVSVIMPARTYPSTVVVTFASRPRIDDEYIFVEEYHIQGLGTGLRVTTPRVEDIAQAPIPLSTLTPANHNQLRRDLDRLSPDSPASADLTRRLLGLLSDRFEVANL